MIADTKLEKLYQIADTIYITSFRECQDKKLIPELNSLVLDEFGNELQVVSIEDNVMKFCQEGNSENYYFKAKVEDYRFLPKNEVLTLVNLKTVDFFSNSENMKDLVQWVN